MVSVKFKLVGVPVAGCEPCHMFKRYVSKDYTYCKAKIMSFVGVDHWPALDCRGRREGHWVLKVVKGR